MPLKTWIVGAVKSLDGWFTRTDLPSRPPAPGREAYAMEPTDRDDDTTDEEHLGPYAPLICAIRDELERFILMRVRLHLAIAEHDRFVLTSIELRHADAAAPAELVQRFMREFKPEQIRRYIARRIVARLANAAAIDLSQFGGLVVADADAQQHTAEQAGEGGEYGELLRLLQSDSHPLAEDAYRVRVRGRWSEADPSLPARPSATASVARTPLAGARLEIDIEDAAGRRRTCLSGVVAGRRYVVGKDDGCEVPVDGAYSSRRHCEIWFDRGRWRVADAGSTNGIRVELAGRVTGRAGSAAGAQAVSEIELPPGSSILLSAFAEGGRGDYPLLVPQLAGAAHALATPLAPRHVAATAVTSMAAPRRESRLVLTIRMASGEESVELWPSQLPLSVGRSRNGGLVVDQAHEGVSGHHLDVIGVDAASAIVLVHGDNGVLLGSDRHGSGEQVVWRAGETMLLGRASPEEPTCALTLAARA